jgi:polyisoprenoid-binding protein YceI
MKLRPVFLLLLLLAAPAFAGDVRGVCDVRFLGSSTLHDFSGKGVCRPFNATMARDAAGKAVLPSVEVEVSVAEMTTENDSRDGQMRKMFDADRFPRIRASARGIDVDRLREEMGKDGEGKAPLDLTLRIRDAEREVRATASGLKESGERVTFVIEFPLSLKEFDLKAPSVLGFIRVRDKVTVKASFTLTVSRSP